MKKQIIIDGKKIGYGCKPYIIAEMSANHNGDINNALNIIEMSKRAGADAVKLQTYKPDTITLNSREPDFMIESGLWHGQSLYDLYESAFMPWEWHKILFDYANKIGITIFSSPFDNTAVDLLENLNTPAYKIASFEAIDIPLIKYVASTGKPMIISTGMADADEIKEAIEAAENNGCSQLAILHCVSGYPAPAADYNLATISNMKDKFKLPVGLSDHTLENSTAIASVALGACIVEKHVTLNRNGGGPDDSFSLEETELSNLCSSAVTAWQAIGNVNYGRKSSENGNAKFRRSLYFVNDLKENQVINEKDIKSIRPGFGLAPKEYDNIIGKKVKKCVTKGTAVKWELINE